MIMPEIFYTGQECLHLQTILFSDTTLLPLTNFALVDKHNHSHLPPTNTNMAIFPQIITQIKFINWGTNLCNHIAGMSGQETMRDLVNKVRKMEIT